jgi:hypothetical protein
VRRRNDPFVLFICIFSTFLCFLLLVGGVVKL